MALPQGPATKEWNDGYVQTPYFNGHGGGVHYDVNSTSQQNLAEISLAPPAAAQVCSAYRARTFRRSRQLIAA